MATEKLVFNIDSRFRNNPETSTSSNFTVNLPTPIRNVNSIKLVSEEIPNVFYAFETDYSTILQVRPGPDPSSGSIYTHQEWETILLAPGNYDAESFIEGIRDGIGRALGFPQTDNTIIERGFGYTINKNTGESGIRLLKRSLEYQLLDSSAGAPQTFEVNFTPVNLNEVHKTAVSTGAFTGISDEDKYIREIEVYSQAIEYYVRTLEIGVVTLNEIMGFKDFLLYAKDAYTATSLINTRGFNYVLLDVNGYDTLTHVSKDNELKVFAKIPFKVTKFFTSVSSVGATTYPKLFDQPETIRRFSVRLLDIFGNDINLRNININLMFEVEYFRTQKGYDKARNKLIPDGSITNFSSEGSRTSYQSQRKERLRNIVFKS